MYLNCKLKIRCHAIESKAVLYLVLGVLTITVESITSIACVTAAEVCPYGVAALRICVTAVPSHALVDVYHL